MTQADFDKGMIVAAAWRLASSSDVNELLAVACVLRNAVVRGRFKTYGDAVNFYTTTNPLRGYPRGNEPQLIDPNEGLLGKVDAVYDCSLPDVTSAHNHPNGASVFAVARKVPDFVAGKELIGTFGGTQFYE